MGLFRNPIFLSYVFFFSSVVFTFTKAALIRATGTSWLAHGLRLFLPYMPHTLRGSFTVKLDTEKQNTFYVQ